MGQTRHNTGRNNGRFCRRRIVRSMHATYILCYFVQSGSGGGGSRMHECTGRGRARREGTMGRGTGAPDKAIEIRTRKRGRGGDCVTLKNYIARGFAAGFVLSFFLSFFFQQRLLALRRTVSLPCLFTLWLEGEGLGRELIVEGEGERIRLFFSTFLLSYGESWIFFSRSFFFFFLEISEHEH